MKAKFTGDPRDPKAQLPDVHTFGGVDFPKGKFVTVPTRLHAKIEGNNHFEVQGSKEDPAPAAGDAGGEEAILPSTAGDPETSTIETKLAQGEVQHEATEPMGDPGVPAKAPGERKPSIPARPAKAPGERKPSIPARPAKAPGERKVQ